MDAKPEISAEGRSLVAEIIDLIRSRVIEQQVLDLLDEPR